MCVINLIVIMVDIRCDNDEDDYVIIFGSHSSWKAVQNAILKCFTVWTNKVAKVL